MIQQAATIGSHTHVLRAGSNGSSSQQQQLADDIAVVSGMYTCSAVQLVIS